MQHSFQLWVEVVFGLQMLLMCVIIAGLLITSNIIPLKTPVMSMPPLLKLGALIVTIIGVLLALELASLTSKQYKPTPQLIPHHFSNMLGFFPAVIHRLTPKLNLTLGQAIASQMVDQTWLEKIGPKAVASASLPMITTASNTQQGMIKTYLILFALTLTIAILALFL